MKPKGTFVQTKLGAPQKNPCILMHTFVGNTTHGLKKMDMQKNLLKSVNEKLCKEKKWINIIPWYQSQSISKKNKGKGRNELLTLNHYNQGSTRDQRYDKVKSQYQ